MTWWRRAAQNISSMRSGSPSTAALEDSVENIRALMLGSLGASAGSSQAPVARRIRYAQDLQALWYLRGDLMAALAALHGESSARKVMLDISDEFDGLLPGGLASRPSPLG